MWNKAKCILLKTKKNSGLLLGLSKFGILVSYDTKYVNPDNDIYSVKQHLYIINDDIIKEGEICFHSNINEICVADEFMVENPDCKKVIATTDKSLSPKLHKGEIVDNSYPEEFKTILPQIPQSFIEQYITEYNQGHQITDCLVEFEGVDCEDKIFLDHRVNEGCGFRVKLNQSNEVNIKTVKDSFSREEVVDLINKFERDTCPDRFEGYGTEQEDIDKFIEQNL